MADKHHPSARILLIANTFPPIHGGSAVVYGGLCEHLPSGSIHVLTASRRHTDRQEIRGHQAHDASTGYPVDRMDYLRPPSLPPSGSIWESLRRLLWIDLPLNIRILLKVLHMIRKHRLNVVCVGELVSHGWLAPALKRLTSCRIIMYIHGEEVTTHTSGRLSGDRRASYLASADAVVAVSSFTAQALQQMLRVPAEKIRLIPNGVDTRRFHPAEPDTEFLAREGLSGCRFVLTVARLVERKGIDMAIQAMSIVKQSIADVKLVIVGEGPHRTALEARIEQLGLQHAVRLTGSRSFEDVLKLFQGCELFLMPNRTLPDGDTEGFGLVFREANACGKAVIGGAAGGAVDAIAHGQSGYLVDGTRPEDIAARVIELLCDAPLRTRMEATGLALARAGSTAAVAQQFLHLCEALVAGADSPTP
ncbi:glycosyltransferase family 1 protein [Aquabacterium lacunae]|jgi:glycosyltransferase involved in cell wall biosynthesis|uniref:Glycosyltransferase family 1 protein n=1 Tax=Aquabacterium lacunae TaxID=2528630 RepID=A0A4Q9GXV1_9BURK|nr:glycosyltransferase family 4 protein [Aquabacterium lacunae]TBO30236.1 glycosyltransferase family 1 protein [Aquabacterium lacunae]